MYFFSQLYAIQLYVFLEIKIIFTLHLHDVWVKVAFHITMIILQSHLR